jgi:predicted nucleic acid-binding Zn ribbon protein
VEEVGKILPAILKRNLRGTDARVVEILAPFWPHVAGKAMAQQCQPVAFREGTLTLATECSCWSAQLRQMAEEIRAEINSFLGKPVVKKLRVQRVARFERRGRPEPHGKFPPRSP